MILSTVGTSLLTNVLPQEERGRVFKLANATEADIGNQDRLFLDGAAALAKSRLRAADRAGCKRLSAELNGIFTLEDERGQVEPAHHLLFATDTYAGRLAAGLLHEWLLSHKQSCEIFVPPELRTSRLDDFRMALADAVPEIARRIDGYRDKHYEVLFNLTGGFKGVQGFMQALAMLKGIESVYVFETSSELMHIPRLPVGPAAEQAVSRNFDLFRTMAAGTAAPEASVRAVGIPETLLFIMDGQAVLSEWGKTIWSSAWTEAASAALLERADPRIAYAAHFRRDAKRLPPNRLCEVNEAIDSLSLWLDGAERRRGRHKIEKLTNPKPPATHELYGWSDQDAGRIYFHLKGSGAVIDFITPHPKEC